MTHPNGEPILFKPDYGFNLLYDEQAEQLQELFDSLPVPQYQSSSQRAELQLAIGNVGHISIEIKGEYFRTPQGTVDAPYIKTNIELHDPPQQAGFSLGKRLKPLDEDVRATRRAFDTLKSAGSLSQATSLLWGQVVLDTVDLTTPLSLSTVHQLLAQVPADFIGKKEIANSTEVSSVYKNCITVKAETAIEWMSKEMLEFEEEFKRKTLTVILADGAKYLLRMQGSTIEEFSMPMPRQARSNLQKIPVPKQELSIIFDKMIAKAHAAQQSGLDEAVRQ